MHMHSSRAPVLLAGAAAVLLTGCGVSDVPRDPPASARPVVALPTLDIPTTALAPTADPQLAPLWTIVNRDTTVLNADLDPLLQCEVYITDVGACRSALTRMQAQLSPMLIQLHALQVGDDLEKPHSEMEQAITLLQSGCADDLRYLDSRNHDDNVRATQDLNHGFGLLDAAQLDMPPDPNATPVPGGS